MPPPVHIGPFVLETELAKGGMGQVWRARHGTMGFPVALKFVKSAWGADADARAGFRNEVRAAAALNHSNIVILYDQGEAERHLELPSGDPLVEGTPWLAMELVTGGTLQSRLGMLDWVEVHDVLQAVLAGLAHAHAKGVLHCDVKPLNVLCGGPSITRQSVKLADFGLAQLARQAESSRRGRRWSIGTPGYMAPEQVKPGWVMGPWTDLYALGCLAVALVTGRPPFAELDTTARIRAQLTGQVPTLDPLLDVPAGFVEWVRQLLVTFPRRRFQRAADAADALFGLGEPARGSAKLPGRGGTFAPRADATATFDYDLSAFDDVDVFGSATTEDHIERRARPAPTMGDDWRVELDGSPLVNPAGAKWSRRLALAAGGLGLFGLRATPLVGREQQRDRLWAELLATRDSGAARAVVLRGPTGCGKSRLARWLCERAEELGAAKALDAAHGAATDAHDWLGAMLARHLRLSDHNQATLAEQVRVLLQASGLTDELDARALLQLVAPQAGADDTGDESVPAFATTEERFTLVSRVLRAVLGTDRPIIIWLDDVHWGHDALLFSRFLLEPASGPPTPILLLLTADDEALADNPEEAALLDALEGRNLDVGPLPDDEHARLVRELIDLQGDVAARVLERTAGSPLFAVELIGDWVQRGILQGTDHGFRLAPGARLDLPEDVAAVWASRVERVLEDRPDDDRKALEIAAMLGQEVDAGEWAAACAAKTVSLEVSGDLSEALITRGLASATSTGGFAFVSAVVRDCLTASAADHGRSARLHDACATMLGARSGPRHQQRLGRHLKAAGRLVDAIEPLTRAARGSMDRSELNRAELLLKEREAVLTAIPLALGDPRWGRGWILAGRLFKESGRLSEAMAQYDRAHAAATTHGWDEVFSDALIGQAGVAVKGGEIDRAAEILAQTLDYATERGDRRTAAEARIGICKVLTRRGETAALHREAEDALAAYRALGPEPQGRGLAFYYMGVAGIVDRTRGDAGRNMRRARELFAEVGNRQMMAGSLNGLGEVQRFEGALVQAAATYREAAEQFDAIGSGDTCVPLLNLGLVQVDSGTLAKARRTLETAQQVALRHGRPMIAAISAACRLPCLAADADWEAFDGQLAESVKALAETGCIQDVAATAQKAGTIAAAAQELDRARAAFDLALGQWRGLGRDAEAAAVEEALVGLGPGA